VLESPPPPRLPRSEFTSRWQRLQAALAEEDLDLLVVYGDDHAVFGPAQVRYLTDFPVHFEPALVLLGRSGEPVVATGPETVGHAALVACAGRCVAIDEFCVPGIVYPNLETTALPDVVRDLGGDRGRYALVGLDQMPVELWQRLTSALGPPAKPFDAELMAMRAVKSPEELEIFRAAYAVTQAGWDALLAACRPGAREYEVAAAAEGTMRALGAEGTAIDTIVASGPDNSAPVIGRTGDRQLRPGDWVAVTLASRVRGYSGPIGRLISLGPPAEAIREVARVAHEAQELAIDALAVGRPMHTVDAPAREHLNRHGFESAYGCGHSVGVQEFEAPFIMPGDDRRIVGPAVFSIDIGIFGGGPWGGFRMEDSFIVDDGGCQQMTTIPRGLVEVPA
jgi:Xaa-Pro aminopeptidase